MAGTFYQELTTALTPFLGEKNVQSCLNRQLRRVGVSETEFNNTHLKTISGTLRGSMKLYCEDPNQCLEACSVITKFL